MFPNSNAARLVVVAAVCSSQMACGRPDSQFGGVLVEIDQNSAYVHELTGMRFPGRFDALERESIFEIGNGAGVEAYYRSNVFKPIQVEIIVDSLIKIDGSGIDTDAMRFKDKLENSSLQILNGINAQLGGKPREFEDFKILNAEGAINGKRVTYDTTSPGALEVEYLHRVLVFGYRQSLIMVRLSSRKSDSDLADEMSIGFLEELLAENVIPERSET